VVSARRAADDLSTFFHARSVAVIGASPQPGKLGRWPLDAMRALGYDGVVTAVNPNYDEVAGFGCVRHVGDLPADVEAAIVVLPAERCIEVARQCGARGLRHLVISASGFAETEQGVELEASLREVADELDLRICGPNTDGLANVVSGLSLSFQPVFHAGPAPRPGVVSILSQSGACVSTVGAALRTDGVGLCYTVACGNQLNTTLEDFALWMADDPASRVIVVFLETVTRPEDLAEAVHRCRASGKSLVALKVGQSALAQRAVTSHTGSLAGSYENTLAFLRSLGVRCVESLDELIATAKAVALAGPPPGTPRKVACMSISGGIAALMADTARRIGLDLAPLSPQAEEQLRALTESSLPLNPYDLAGRFSPDHVGGVLGVLARDGYTDLVVAGGMLPEIIRGPFYEAVARMGGRHFDRVSLFSPWLDDRETVSLGELGVVTGTNLRAILESHRASAPARPPATVERWPDLPPVPDASGQVDEVRAKAFVAGLGIPVPPSALVPRGTSAVASAEHHRRPLVL
jgi:acyl-CoA synthetase (NDP forming)